MKDILINKLRASELITDASTESEDRISGLTCPACGRPKAFCYKNNPGHIYCGGLKKCGAKTSTADFLGIHKDIEKDYPSTKSDPNLPAVAYLQIVRLLMLSLVGLVYKYFSNIRDLGCGAVMFPLGKDASGKEVLSGRIFNPPDGEGKTHNIGSISGKCFIHPGIIYNKNTDLYIAEGIFDALSLIEMRLAAIAILSANVDISKLDLPPHRNLIFAYDNDPAGIKVMKKSLQLHKNAAAILPPKGQDWNDFLIAAGNGEKARKMFDARYNEFLFNADLALSANPKSYVEIYTDYYDYPPELFEYKGRYYSGRETRDGILYALKVADFTVTTDHYQKTEDQKSTGYIYRYYLIIKHKNGRKTKIIMEGHELATTDLVRKAFLSRGKVLWEGDKAATMAFSRMIVDAKNAPIVRQIDVVGYDEVTRGYYFGDFAIDVQGRRLSLNAKGFFKVSAHEYVVPFPYATIKPSDHPVDINRIYNLIIDAWGERGAVAVAFTVTSWFVNMVKQVTAFFPFLSLWGDTQTGKSRLTRVLNNMQAIDEEGMPLMETNTKKGGLRKISQVSGLLKALLEGNSRDNRSFDYSSLLPLYNKGNSLQTTAIKSMDTRTREVPFRGTLMFVQNTEPFKTKAEKERVDSVHFSSEQITDATKKAFDELMKIPAQDLATFIVNILKHRKQIESIWESIFEKNKVALVDVGDFRIIENHALILTFHQILCDILGIEYDLLPYMTEIAELKKEACNNNSNPVTELFFGQLNEIQDEERSRFCEIDPDKGRLYLHLPEALKTLANLGYQQPSSHILTKEFRECAAFVNASLKYRFKTERKRGADERPKQKRVWVFDITKI